MVPSRAFPTVDVPDHAHYTIGVIILAVGITGMVGNFLVIYAFCRYFFYSVITLKVFLQRTSSVIIIYDNECRYQPLIMYVCV